MSRSAIITVVVLVGILLVVGYIALDWRTASDVANEQTVRAALTAGDSEAGFTSASGEQVALGNYMDTDNIVIVTSWASWCPSCDEQLQLFNEFATEHAETVSVLAINRKERPNQANSFLRTVGELPQLEIVLDPDDHFYQVIEGYTIPETVFYDQDGVKVYHHRGTLTIEKLQQIVSEIKED